MDIDQTSPKWKRAVAAAEKLTAWSLDIAAKIAQHAASQNGLADAVAQIRKEVEKYPAVGMFMTDMRHAIEDVYRPSSAGLLSEFDRLGALFDEADKASPE